MAFSRPAESSSGTFVDTTSLEEQFLKCSVCLEKFDQNMRIPKQLSCNHTFCKRCLISVHESAPPLMLKCPTCRKEHRIGDTEVQHLPTDHRTIQMMDFLSAADKQKKDVCQKHPGELLKFFCRNCEVPICRDCTITLHKAHEGHDITDVSQAFSELKPKFNNARDTTNIVLKRLKQQMEFNATSTSELDKNKSDVTKQIGKAFAEYQLVLEQRKAQLLAQVDEKTKSHKSKAESQNDSISLSVATITILHEKFEEATKCQDVGQLVILSHLMDEWADSVDGIGNAIRSPRYIFQQLEEPFKEQVRGLGEIEVKEEPPVCDVELFLIGKTGHGKSATGNTILGREKFDSSELGSGTVDTNAGWTEINGVTIKVVDGPGVLHIRLVGEKQLEQMENNVSKGFVHCPNGFQALLLVLKYGTRFTDEERKTVKLLKGMLGDDFTRNHCILVFTHGEAFLSLNPNRNFNDWCRKQEGGMRQLIDECNNRVVLFYNLMPEKRNESVNQLISLAQGLRHGRYTAEIFDRIADKRSEFIRTEGAIQFKLLIQGKILP